MLKRGLCWKFFKDVNKIIQYLNKFKKIQWKHQAK